MVSQDHSYSLRSYGCKEQRPTLATLDSKEVYKRDLG